MKRISYILLIFVIGMCSPCEGVLQTARMVEEKKRVSLRKSEVLIEKLEEEEDIVIKGVREEDYFYRLINKKVALNEDAVKIIIIFLGLENEYIDTDSQVSYLKENGFFPKKMIHDIDLQRPLEKGVLAYLYCKALNIKGGLILRIFGLSQRYALKELEYEGITLPGKVNDIVSGKEMVHAFSGAVSHLSERANK